MTLPTATDILNMYLYGQTTPPNIDIDNASSLIRSPSATSNINVSVTEFMAGPGRFAVPAQFGLVQGFFNAAPGTFTAGQGSPKAKNLLGIANEQGAVSHQTIRLSTTARHSNSTLGWFPVLDTILH